MKKINPYSVSTIILMNILIVLAFAPKLNAQEADSLHTSPDLIRGFANDIKPGIRSTALADAAVADYRELSSIYINPAVLSFVNNLERIEFNSSQSWDNNLMLQNFALPLFANIRHRVAVQTGIMHSGLKSANPFISSAQPSLSLTLYRFDIAYAYSITPTLSVGVLNSTAIADNSYAAQLTNALAFGMVYVPSKSISYGIAFRGLGRDLGYERTESERTILFTQNMTESVEVGATLKYPVDTDHTYFSLSLANEKRFGEPGIWYKVGLELTPIIVAQLPKLQVRNGLIMEPESKVYAPTFGIGMDFTKLSFSYSISPGKQLNARFHQLGIIIHFDKF